MRRLATSTIIGFASLLVAAGSVAEAALVHTAQGDGVPASVQDVNPSKAEPMMLGPTQDEDAANYRRDFVACDSETGGQRESCRETVDQEYRPEVTNLAGACEELDGPAKTACLKRNGATQ